MNKTIITSSLLLCGVLLQGCNSGKKEASAEPIKVEVVAAGNANANAERAFSGTVEEESGSALSFSTMGTVKNVYVSEGQMVGKGTLIAEVDPASVRNAYNAALAARQQAEDAYQRMKILHDKGSLAEIKWMEVQSQVKQAVSSEQIAKKSLNDCRLYSPVSGYVSEKSVDVGQNVIPGQTVAKVVRIERVKVKVSVPEEEISTIGNVQTATVSVAALGGRTFTGRIVEKGVSANALSRSYDVKVLLDNPGRKLLPGMVCDVAISGGETAQASAMMLPAKIVQIDIDNRPFVWLAANGKAKKAYITVGESVCDNVVILNGLTANDKVIVKGQQKVSEGTKITY